VTKAMNWAKSTKLQAKLDENCQGDEEYFEPEREFVSLVLLRELVYIVIATNTRASSTQ